MNARPDPAAGARPDDHYANAKSIYPTGNNREETGNAYSVVHYAATARTRAWSVTLRASDIGELKLLRNAGHRRSPAR